MRADRLLTILMLLQTRGKMTAAELAEEVGVSRRTILRDVDALSFAGVPVYAEGGHGGGIALDEAYRTTLTGLKEMEIRTLFVSGNAPLLNQIGMGDAAENSLLKLSAALPLRHQPIVQQMRQRVYIDPLWWWHDTQTLPHLETLQQAVFEDCRIEVTYEHYNGEIVERTLEPYSLVAKASLWYLIARRDGDFRIYRVSRFHRVTTLPYHYERDAAFDLPTFWHDHLQEFTTNLAEFTFTLRIDQSRLPFARWLTPGRCQILKEADESGWLVARFALESEALAKMLVFGLGAQAVVLDPPSLRDAVLETAHALLAHQSHLE